MDINDTSYQKAYDIIVKISNEKLEHPRPEKEIVRANDKKNVKKHNRIIRMLKRDYDVYETTASINGEEWLMACCYGDLKRSKTNQLTFIYHYHMVNLEDIRENFFHHLKQNTHLFIALIFFFMPYLANLAYFASLPFENTVYYSHTFMATCLFGVFLYWPLGIVTGYVSLYFLLF